MSSIQKITIKITSGYVGVEDTYSDSLKITSNSISYQNVPYIKSNAITWSYKSSNSKFKAAFDEISKETETFLKESIFDECCDCGTVEFQLTYSDNTKKSYIFLCPLTKFKKIFRLIKPLVPPLESIRY